MQSVAQLNQELTINANIEGFLLADWVKEDSEVVHKLREFVKTGKRAILTELRRAGALVSVKRKHNMIVTVGRTVLARRLAADTTYTGAITHCGLGNGGSPTPTGASTSLQSEVYRKAVSSLAFDNNIVYADFFFTAAEVSGTFTEFGNFIDGTATANSGQMFSFMATGGWVKSNSQSLFVSCKYTIS